MPPSTPSSCRSTSHDDDRSDQPLDVQYRIVNAEQDAAPFVIEKKTGVLRTREKLDREMQAQYILDIEIAEVNPDSGHSLMSRTPVIISIENVNDNPPQLVSQIVRCQAYNSLPKDIPVCHVIAFDLDDVSAGSSSSPSHLVYDIIEGNDYAFFKIDPTKGSIYFAQEKEIPNKAYDLTVSCVFFCLLLFYEIRRMRERERERENGKSERQSAVHSLNLETL